MTSSRLEQLGPGTRLGEYRIEALLRAGPVVSVYRASQPVLGRDVTVYASTAPAASPKAARFLKRALALAALDHPNVLAVYEAGEVDGRAFAITPVVEGRGLDEVLQHQALAPEMAAEVSTQLASAVEAVESVTGEPAELTAESVVLVDESDGVRAYLDPLPAAADDRPDRMSEPSSVTLARLLGEARADAAQRGVVGRARSRRALAAAGAAAALAAAVVGVIVLGGAEQASAPRPPATTPGGRLAATIPLGGVPGSITFGEGAVWVAMNNGTVLQIDPRTNRVIGRPVPFGRPAAGSNLTLRAGDGAVFAVLALEGGGGMVTRIDADTRRVTARRRFGQLLHTAAVDDGVLWVTSSRSDSEADSELVRLSARSLKPIGRTHRFIGGAPHDIEVADGMAWIASVAHGSLTRVRPALDEVKTITPAGQIQDTVLHAGELWAADWPNGVILRIDPEAMRLKSEVVRADFGYALVAVGGALWAASTTTWPEGGSARLHRIDPAAGRLVGASVSHGGDFARPAGGAGAIWIRSGRDRAVLKFTPTQPAPAARPAPKPREPFRLMGGPLHSGRWESRSFAIPFSLQIEEAGWVNTSYLPDSHTLHRVGDDGALAFHAPRQLFLPDGGVTRVRSAQQVVGWLLRHPHLRVSRPSSTRVGGVPARTTLVEVDSRRVDSPSFCDVRCVLSFGTEGGTHWFEAGSPTRVHVLSRATRPVVVTESGFDRTSKVLTTLRFR